MFSHWCLDLHDECNNDLVLKNPNADENSTFASEFVVMQIAKDLIVALR